MSNQEKKLISFILPILVGGGLERVVVNLANQFARNGYPVDIVLWSGIAESPYNDDIDDSIKVISIRGPQKQYNFLIKGLVALFSLKKLIKYIAQANPGVIFASNCEHVTILANELTKNKAKLVVMIHMDPSFLSFLKMQGNNMGRLFILRMLSKWLYPKADRIIGVSKGIADFMIKDGIASQEKTGYIYNPAFTSSLREKSKESPTHKWLLNKTRPVFVAAGRLSPEKNFALLLKAFKLVVDKIDAVLLVLGEGPLLDDLKKLSAELCIEHKADFMGFTKNPFSILTNSDVFVLSSDSEGCPMVIVEALACGCQVVSTNCSSGPAEILENGKYGRLTPVGNESKLAEAMLSAISEPIDRDLMLKRAEAFDEKIIGRQYIALAEELMDNKYP
jgi:glycosyltransferase involved in cell wall biosynthesis